MPIAFLNDLGGGELMMILVVVLVLFGGKRMPEIAKGMGKAARELKKATGAVENEFKRAMEEADVKSILAPPEEAPRPLETLPPPEPPIAEHGPDNLPIVEEKPKESEGPGSP